MIHLVCFATAGVAAFCADLGVTFACVALSAVTACTVVTPTDAGASVTSENCPFLFGSLALEVNLVTTQLVEFQEKVPV